ncbi:TmrB [Cellulomonas flavigena DSM 20109]|uniref:TmrB n=1 Tax=Cellulomonas flavigena (strain ATCC 482 / DSM 20109 / BCRC 11376 / JCM 18109 / NBRC 3775 / NCIMB 8073 / NRS 134) TaxID=446466 RepID=D5UHQ9_CELFN|nr:AAA family ATPase [Cellulomonas flavigena]ADG73333.1 TmrB [Cellulomonas flavigena DSM 20109]
MILWLNGPFGVGKSTCARLLLQGDSQARQYNPERLGWLIRRTVGRVRPGDFQDRPVWRRGVVHGAHRAARRTPTLVVPMTLLRADYADEILGGLRAAGHEVVHVTLHASHEALVDRIENDTDDPGARSWRLDQASRYFEVADRLAALGPQVDTEGRAAHEVAAAVVTAAERTRSA